MQKNNTQLLSISKAAHMLGLINKKNHKPMTHTLRFWETKFKQLKPTILSGGRRYYSEKNIKIIKMIIFLLKDQCLTINGAIKAINLKPKDLDETKASSIKDKHFKKNINIKSKKILEKIKWLKKPTLK